MDHALINLLLFTGFFLITSTFLKWWSERSNFPYTLAVLLIGFFVRGLFIAFNIHLDLHLSSDFIFFVLLPILLFESATHIQLHQFRLQFKTITFLATFGLLLSVGIVGMLMALFLDYPLMVGLMFGAIISATDPISVLSLFKTLGTPKRLSLLAEGESMFNDATAVVIFRILATIVIGHQVFNPSDWLLTTGNFFYIFVGSIVAGGLMGLGTSMVISNIKNDRIIETTLTLALALGSFVISEHFFHLSGVIATVAAGLVLGNIGKTKISGSVVEFMNEFWEYIGFLAVTMVFFFAAFDLDPSNLVDDPLPLVITIAIVLVARSISVYTSFFLTNLLPIFKDEPNVPKSWQHVLNWGGLRGVIPLVLAYSLPETFVYKQQLLGLTIEIFLFSLIVQGLTVGRVVQKNNLHLKSKDKKLVSLKNKLFSLEKESQMIGSMSSFELPSDIKLKLENNLARKIGKQRQKLLSISNSQDLFKSFSLQLIEVERRTVRDLFQKGTILEATVFEFESELDLQQDAIEYPNLVYKNVVDQEGQIDSQSSFRKKLRTWRQLANKFPIIKKLHLFSTNTLINERLSLLRARVISSEQALDYLDSVAQLFNKNKNAARVISKLKKEHLEHLRSNQTKLNQLATNHKQITHLHFRSLSKKLSL